MESTVLSSGSRKQLPFVSDACEKRLRISLLNADRTRRKTGIYPRNGSYTAVIGFQNRLYHLGMFEEYPDAVEARILAEELLYADFKTAYESWNALPDYWKEEKPFSFIPAEPCTVRRWIREEKKIIRQPQTEGCARKVLPSV